MKAEEMREKSKADLDKVAEKLRQELAMARMQLRANQLANTSKVKALQRELARTLTIRQMG